MPDLRDLPDLAREVRDRVVTPPYDEVSRRVRARRLRGATGTILAAVLLLGGVTAWQIGGTTHGARRPEPGRPAHLLPIDEPMWRAVVDGTDAHPYEVTGGDDGSIAVVWRALEQPAPTFALVIREADGTVHGRRLDVPVSLTPVPGGWVGVHTARGWFVGADGTWTDLGPPGPPHKTQPGDVFIAGQQRRWIYSPASHAWSLAATVNSAVDAAVALHGWTVVCEASQGTVTTGFQGNARSVPGSSCLVDGNNGTFAVAALGDDPDGSIPLTGLMLSLDDGDTWTTIEDLPRNLRFTSLAVTADGTTVVSAEDRAFVFHPNGHYSELEPDLGVVTAAGYRLYATTYGVSKGPLLYSDDDGSTWRETTLPGME
jgi:hypothetical protein